ncbi:MULTISPECIES: hypothetical protein [Streptomyces]|uniref:hypothetical protein n=1 Tax=Streptomyces TaxID=1883 RepID=UPI000ACB60C6|nr:MULTISPECIES: hypothetical protein [Streptomyces]MDI5911605.1 hypothetical protein [Streptomyces sp. 12257]
MTASGVVAVEPAERIETGPAFAGTVLAARLVGAPVKLRTAWPDVEFPALTA